jgi:hypothetical protein
MPIDPLQSACSLPWARESLQMTNGPWFDSTMLDSACHTLKVLRVPQQPIPQGVADPVLLGHLPQGCDIKSSRLEGWRRKVNAMKVVNCERCDSTGWVCEAHDDRPWESGATSRPCECGAPGKPCPMCNRSDPPNTSRMGFRIMHWRN